MKDFLSADQMFYYLSENALCRLFSISLSHRDLSYVKDKP